MCCAAGAPSAQPAAGTVDGYGRHPGREGWAGRSGFHESHAKYRLRGAKRVVAVDYLGLPVGVRVVGASRHEVGAARDLLDELLPRHPWVLAVLGDRGFGGLEGPMLRDHGVRVEIKHRDRSTGEFKPIRPLWRVEDCFAELGRWRRLARSFEPPPGVGDGVDAGGLCGLAFDDDLTGPGT